MMTDWVVILNEKPGHDGRPIQVTSRDGIHRAAEAYCQTLVDTPPGAVWSSLGIGGVNPEGKPPVPNFMVRLLDAEGAIQRTWFFRAVEVPRSHRP